MRIEQFCKCELRNRQWNAQGRCEFCGKRYIDDRTKLNPIQDALATRSPAFDRLIEAASTVINNGFDSWPNSLRIPRTALDELRAAVAEVEQER